MKKEKNVLRLIKAVLREELPQYGFSVQVNACTEIKGDWGYIPNPVLGKGVDRTVSGAIVNLAWLRPGQYDKAEPIIQAEAFVPQYTYSSHGRYNVRVNYKKGATEAEIRSVALAIAETYRPV